MPPDPRGGQGLRTQIAAAVGTRTYVCTYTNAQPVDIEQIVAIRQWQDETLNVGDLANQIDYPRTLTVTATNADIGTNMTGTVTINGTDADGAVIAEIVTINVPPGAPVEYATDKAFGIITSIVADQTDVHLGDQYSVGTGLYWGVPNYPLAAAADAFKAVLDGVDSGITTVVAAYGTVLLTAAIAAPSDVVIFYKSAG